MGCGPKNLRRSGSGHTDGSGTPVFSALTDGLPVADYESVKVSMEVLDISSGDLEVAAAVSYSNDGLTWDTPTTLTSYVSADGWTYGDQFNTLSAAKRFVRVGIAVKQKDSPSSTNDENVRVNLDINLKPR